MDTSLNKYISETGFCSRREADKYIEQCRVTINGIEAHKGNRVEVGDIVLVDGELFSWYGSRLQKSVTYFNELIKQL